MIIMPQHFKGASSPVCLIPTDINLQTMEEDCDPEPASNNQISMHLARLFSRSDSQNTVAPNSVSSKVLKLFHVGSQTSCDKYVDCPNVSELSVEMADPASENVYIDPLPRSQTPTDDITCAKSNQAHLEVTPVKTIEPDLDPLTPTTNLKMLIIAASSDMRDRERQKELKMAEVEPVVARSDKTEMVIEIKDSAEVACAVSRKEKSLGLLCQRFLARYPANPTPSEREEICLDEVAKELMVERRRIYDIVNVLESVEMVSRVAKNRYTWHGKSTLQETLLNLKLLAERDGFADKISHIRMYEEFQDTTEAAIPASPCKKTTLMLSEAGDMNKGYYFLRKDKSLGIMSQKFLMLFLVSQNKPINLDLAAKIIIGDPSINLTENAKFKTKIRRLYDIANILTSLDLIQKVYLTEAKGRKPAFKYVGPEVGVAKSIQADSLERPSSRHSLLVSVKKPLVTLAESTINTNQSTELSCTQASLISQKLPIRKPFSRHPSLDQICEVAERERNRLYFESKSHPSSPVKPKTKRTLLPKTKSMPPVSEMPNTEHHPVNIVSDSTTQAQLKHFVMIRSAQGALQKAEVSSADKKNVAVTIQKLPITLAAKQGVNNGLSCEKVLVKTRCLLQQIKGGGECQPRLVKVSKDQLDLVLNSLQKGHQQISTDNPLNSIINPKVVDENQNVPQIHVVRMPQSTQSGANVSASGDGTSRKRTVTSDPLPEAGSDCYFNSKRPRFGEISFDQQGMQQNWKSNKSKTQKSHLSPRLLNLDAQVQPICKRLSPDIALTKTFSSGTANGYIMSPYQVEDIMTPPQSRQEIQGCYTQVAHSPIIQFANPNCSSAVTAPTTTAYAPQLVALHAAGAEWVTSPIQPASMSFNTVDAAKYMHPVLRSPIPCKPVHSPELSGPQLHCNQDQMAVSSSKIPRAAEPSVAAASQRVFTLKPFRGIRPSANTIINLIPHLAGDAAVTTADLSSCLPQVPLIASTRTTPTLEPLLLCPNHPGVITPVQSLVSPRDPETTNVIFTPRDRVIVSPTKKITEIFTNTTPIVGAVPPMPVTPSTYFRSTPGGMYHLTTVPHVLLGQSLSAFQPLNSFSRQSVNTTSSTARRLALVEGDNIV